MKTMIKRTVEEIANPSFHMVSILEDMHGNGGIYDFVQVSAQDGAMHAQKFSLSHHGIEANVEVGAIWILSNLALVSLLDSWVEERTGACCPFCSFCWQTNQGKAVV